jgi:hypothetical protein
MTGELTYQGPGCHFWGDPDTTGWWTLTTDRRESLIFPPVDYRLCPRHLQLLTGAGPQVRVGPCADKESAGGRSSRQSASPRWSPCWVDGAVQRFTHCV